MKTPQNTFKYLIGLVVVLVLRLVPHLPNVEPIMSTMMPFSKKWGWFSGLVFCLASVLVFDLMTGTLGVWSLMTAGTYALLGASAGLYLKNKENKVKYYIGFSVAGTLIYDAITGIAIGMVFFHQSFLITFVGQIPFTLYHLGGNIVLAWAVSPLLYKWVITNPKLETQQIFNSAKLAVRFPSR